MNPTIELHKRTSALASELIRADIAQSRRIVREVDALRAEYKELPEPLPNETLTRHIARDAINLLDKNARERLGVLTNSPWAIVGMRVVIVNGTYHIKGAISATANESKRATVACVDGPVTISWRASKLYRPVGSTSAYVVPE